MPQAGEPTYATKVTPEDLRLEWSRPAGDLARLPRVGRAWTTFRGRRLLVLAAAVSGGDGPAPGVLEETHVGTGEGRLELLLVQPEGKAPLPAAAWQGTPSPPAYGGREQG